MRLDTEVLRESPQLAAIELLIQAADTTVVALCAAHPGLEQTSGLTRSRSSTGLLIDSSTASRACATAFTSIAGPWTTSSASDAAPSTTTTSISKALYREPTLRPLRAQGVGSRHVHRHQAARVHDHQQ